jgi:hypothetical protein
MEIYETKSRIGAAVVESIFRRARFDLKPYQAPGPSLLKFAREDFSPNFLATPADGADRRDVLVEVKYRPFIDPFIALENQRNESSIFRLARKHWPEMEFILVTDHPQEGRSCFQSIAFSPVGELFHTVDLVDVKDLQIFSHNIDDHETLLRRIFSLLSA